MEHHHDRAADRGVRGDGAVVTYDLTKPGTPIDVAKLRTILVGGTRYRPRVEEGRAHSESGLPYKATTDELNNTVTEHSKPGSGVSVRQDAHMRPKTVEGAL